MSKKQAKIKYGSGFIMVNEEPITKKHYGEATSSESEEQSILTQETTMTNIEKAIVLSKEHKKNSTSSNNDEEKLSKNTSTQEQGSENSPNQYGEQEENNTNNLQRYADEERNNKIDKLIKRQDYLMNAVNYYLSLPKETLLESLEISTNELLNFIKETMMLNEKTELLIRDETRIRAIYGVNKYAEVMKNHATELDFKLKEIAGRCTILDNQLNKIQHMIRTNEKWLTSDNTTAPIELMQRG